MTLTSYALMFAASRKLPEDPFEFLVGVAAVGIVLIVIYVVSAIQNSAAEERSHERDTAAFTNYRSWRKKTDRAGGIESGDVGLKLPKGEAGFYAARVTMYEPRSVRVSRHSGFGVRPMRGLGVFEGESTSESLDEWRKVSNGILYITNKRLIFAGDTQSRTIKIDELISVDAEYRAILVRSSKLRKALYFRGLNGLVARDIISTIQSA